MGAGNEKIDAQGMKLTASSPSGPVRVTLDEAELRHLLDAEMLKHGGTAPKNCGVADKLRSALEAAAGVEEESR